jgi:hypothetical protein
MFIHYYSYSSNETQLMIYICYGYLYDGDENVRILSIYDDQAYQNRNSETREHLILAVSRRRSTLSEILYIYKIVT